MSQCCMWNEIFMCEIDFHKWILDSICETPVSRIKISHELLNHVVPHVNDVSHVKTFRFHTWNENFWREIVAMLYVFEMWNDM